MHFVRALILAWTCNSITEAQAVKSRATKDVVQQRAESTIAPTQAASPQADGSFPVRHPAQGYPKKTDHQDEAKGFIQKLKVIPEDSKPREWIKNMANFHTRDARTEEGGRAAQWLQDQIKAISPGIIVEQFTHVNLTVDVQKFGENKKEIQQPSIIAQIPGKNPDLIIIGSHIDSCIWNTTTRQKVFPDARAPGADDNASGMAVALEVLRVLATEKFQPQNTLEFHFYAAEEVGLLGSREVFRSYRAQHKSVLGMLAVDMTVYSKHQALGVFENDVNVDTDFSAFVKTVARDYSLAYGHNEPITTDSRFNLDSNPQERQRPCTDAYSARTNGFPSAFVFEDEFRNKSSPAEMNMNPNYHQITDTYENLDFTAIQRHTEFTMGFLIEASYLSA